MSAKLLPGISVLIEFSCPDCRPSAPFVHAISVVNRWLGTATVFFVLRFTHKVGGVTRRSMSALRTEPSYWACRDWAGSRSSVVAGAGCKSHRTRPLLVLLR
jgi:hypothetical protein